MYPQNGRPFCLNELNRFGSWQRSKILKQLLTAGRFIIAMREYVLVLCYFNYCKTGNCVVWTIAQCVLVGAGVENMIQTYNIAYLGNRRITHPHPQRYYRCSFPYTLCLMMHKHDCIIIVVCMMIASQMFRRVSCTSCLSYIPSYLFCI